MSSRSFAMRTPIRERLSIRPEAVEPPPPPPPPPDTTAPGAPILTGEAFATENVLSWTQPEVGLQYRIYRDGVLVHTTTMLSYTDITDTAVSHTYYVRSVDTAGNVSTNSNSVTLRYTAPPVDPPPSGDDTTPPTAAVLTGYRLDFHTNQLMWSPVTDAVSYRIYRDSVLIATQSGVGFSQSVSVNSVYSYHITSKDAAGNWSVNSNIVTLDKDSAPSPGHSGEAPGHNKDPETGLPTKSGLGSWPLEDQTLGRLSDDPADAIRRLSTSM